MAPRFHCPGPARSHRNTRSTRAPSASCCYWCWQAFVAPFWQTVSQTTTQRWRSPCGLAGFCYQSSLSLSISFSLFYIHSHTHPRSTSSLANTVAISQSLFVRLLVGRIERMDGLVSLPFLYSHPFPVRPPAQLTWKTKYVQPSRMGGVSTPKTPQLRSFALAARDGDFRFVVTPLTSSRHAGSQNPPNGKKPAKAAL